jgi:transcription initiation factor TFIIB
MQTRPVIRPTAITRKQHPPTKKQKQEWWNLAMGSSTLVYDRCAPETDLCTKCHIPMMISENHIPICPDCGVMNCHSLDYTPEWRFYGADDKHGSDPTRCGAPINPLLVESSFGCKVLSTSRSSYEMKKIRKWTEWQSMPHREKSLYDEFQFISIMAQNAGIPKMFIDMAMIYHKDISEQKMFRGLNRDGIKAASIYISCRLHGCPRTAYEIADIFNLDKTSATTGCTAALQILHTMERKLEPEKQTQWIETTPSMFMDRFCSKLNMNSELTMLAKFIAAKVEQQKWIEDNTPPSIAAGIVYFVAHQCNQSFVTKAAVKNVCQVSEVTVTKCYKKLDAHKEELIPQTMLEKYNDRVA